MCECNRCPRCRIGSIGAWRLQWQFRFEHLCARCKSGLGPGFVRLENRSWSLECRYGSSRVGCQSGEKTGRLRARESCWSRKRARQCRGSRNAQRWRRRISEFIGSGHGINLSVRCHRGQRSFEANIAHHFIRRLVALRCVDIAGIHH